ncbi:oligosaccharide flippase family protein [Flavobacterium sp. XGLA_31]|uniref:oligosaccharide flippase family protein n=1 Tax=Flavobacterium sp. XGLA_31 TaxID=3447666 RepID=UPI003F2EAF3B
MSESKKTYQQILKTTSLFGSIQVISIIISVIKSKLISVLIGPVGFGVASLLNATLNVISGISGFGLEVSGVKHVSSNYEHEDSTTVDRQISIIRKLALVTGLLGMILGIVFSKWLSIITFGNPNYTYSFAFISITLFFKQLMSAEIVVLQGLRKLKLLAYANFYGSLVGLLFSVPLYFYFKIDAIVPGIILAYFFSMVFAFVYTKQIKIKKVSLKNDSFMKEAKSILKLGVALTFTGILTLLASYLIQIYLAKNAGIEVVGYYNAGFTLLNSYVGVLFVAMSTDYFPRLAAISHDNKKVKEAILQQALIGVLIITPIILVFFSFSGMILQVLFSAKFKVIATMVSIGVFGMLFRVVSFSMGYVLLAKAESRLFMKTAVGFNSLYFFLSIFGYKWYGLSGLGIAFTGYYFLHLMVLAAIVYKKYNFTFNKEFIGIFVVCVLFCAITFLFRMIENEMWNTVLSVGMILISSLFSIIKINNKVDIIAVLQQKKD